MHSSTDLYLGGSAAWTRAQGEIDALAASDLPIVLLGPTGCGKSALANYIHARSRRTGKLIEHTIGSVPESLSYSAFLGHQRGAYSGAVEGRTGLLESAEGGTLFLDEMGLAPLEVQRLLLGLVEGRPFTPLGASRTLTVDVRLVFATNAEPRTLLAEGKWQPDLYYRLGGNFIRLPGLAARRLDILPLAHLFLTKRLRALGHPWRSAVSDEVQAIFLAHPWPGNIRELQSVCDRAAVLMQCDRPIGLSDLTPEFLSELNTPVAGLAADPLVARVHDVLRRHHGNKSATARELDWPRTVLYRYLDRYPLRNTPSGGFARPA
jgi:DNA-binding NtrC family response regulator